jgi:hypothetical protein
MRYRIAIENTKVGGSLCGRFFFFGRCLLCKTAVYDYAVDSFFSCSLATFSVPFRIAIDITKLRVRSEGVLSFFRCLFCDCCIRYAVDC